MLTVGTLKSSPMTTTSCMVRALAERHNLAYKFRSLGSHTPLPQHIHHTTQSIKLVPTNSLPSRVAESQISLRMTSTLTQTQIDLITWRSLVDRSIKAWDSLYLIGHAINNFTLSSLQSYSSLEDLLSDSAGPRLHFWFMQRREAFLRQTKMPKWSRQRLDEFVLVPATSGFINRKDFFFISHYWQSPQDPDPDGENLRFCQRTLASQEWSYVWIDWTCAPQAPRSASEERYFRRALERMSALIHHCGFMYYYPKYRPRLWILYEIAEYILTASDTSGAETEDITRFYQHIEEMKKSSVRSVIRRYGYTSTNKADEPFLTAWLELLVLLHKLRLNLDDIRVIMDNLTWHTAVESYKRVTPDGWFELLKFEGVVLYRGEQYLFTPFPYWGTHRPRK